MSFAVVFMSVYILKIKKMYFNHFISVPMFLPIVLSDLAQADDILSKDARRTMTVPDICDLFSNDGVTRVDVNFFDFDGQVRSFQMEPDEITRLINPENGLFYTELLFFGRRFFVYKIDIDTLRNIVTVCAVDDLKKVRDG